MRIKHNVEPEQTLKGTPMYSVDGVEIKVNMILYRPVYDSGYNFKKEGSFEIEALRVFHVNTVTRTYRARCIRGCEYVYKVHDQCQGDLFARFENATKVVKIKMKKDMKSCTKKLYKVNETFSHVNSLFIKAKKLKAKNVRVPKPAK